MLDQLEATMHEQKQHLKISLARGRTYLVIAAIHREPRRNTLNRISCKMGVPMVGYVYDTKNDEYHIECAEFFYLGYVPISLKAQVENTHWEFRIPIHESILKNYLSDQQKLDLKKFMSHFKADDYHIEYIQMIDSKC